MVLHPERLQQFAQDRHETLRLQADRARSLRRPAGGSHEEPHLTTLIRRLQPRFS